ncbi:MAG: 2-amino-4-hydroxy-6-hydroxymethyldihydropteridine diphosphokinase [Opitutales bacterium]|nr:2-amino-4-hydroxy-6-hydroxymethyldihydropteridine diphosphokinase [Opitutales bacterium]
MNADIYLGLGANLGEPSQTFELALALVGRFAKIHQVSKLYKSSPFGFSDQPPFVNAAAQISTSLEPLDLLTKLQFIEGALGKEVIRKNGPRIIDLDLLIYGDRVIEEQDLTIPHPGILTRDFVLRPLLDISPDLSHPSWKPKTLKSALGGLQENFIRESPEEWNLQL